MPEQKVAIVTGCSRGIGRAIALRLAGDGFSLGINDIDARRADLDQLAEEVSAKGGKVFITTGDVSNEDYVVQMVQDVVANFGQLNVMVANAGILIVKNMFQLSMEEFDKIQAVNCRGVFMCYREAAKQVIKQGKGGKIIGAGSTSSHRPQAMNIAYGISKFGVRAMTQAAAMELAQHNINVNAYCPGITRTPMWDSDALGAESKRLNIAEEKVFSNYAETRTAMKRASEPEDIANLVSFLASEQSRQMTGQSVLMDGGMLFS